MKQIPINSEPPLMMFPSLGTKISLALLAHEPQPGPACIAHEGEAWHRRIMYFDYRPCGCAGYSIILVPWRIVNLNKLLLQYSIIIIMERR